MASPPDRRETLALLAAAAAFARPALSLAAPVELGLTEARARFFLPVGINGEAGMSFLLDTGSPAHVVSESLATRLNLPVVGRRRLRAYDGGGDSPVVRVERFGVGGMTPAPANLVVWPDQRLQGQSGLIGYPLLAEGAVLSLGARTLSLDPSAAAGGTLVRAEIGRGGAVLLGGLPEADGRFAFDTGAQEVTVSAAYHARIADNPAYRDAPKIVVRGQANAGQVLGFRPEAMRFGDFVCANPLVRIAQAGDGRDGVFQGVDGLIGVALLRRYVWAIQPARLSVLAEVAPPARAAGLPALAPGQLGTPLTIPAQGGPSPFGGVSFGAPVFEPAPPK